MHTRYRWAMTRARFIAALFIVASALGAPACKKSSTTSDGLTKVKVQLNWVPEPEFGGLYAARDGGAYKKAGLEVEIAGGGPGSPVVQLVAAGKADFGVAAAEDVIVARARDADVVAIFATFQTSPQGVMVHAARGLKSLQDLTSGTLALETGAPVGAYLKKKFGFAGVTIVPNDGGVAKFLTDTSYAQQCYVTSEPLAAKEKGGDPQVFLAAEAGFDPYANVVITRGSLLKDNLPMVKAFVAATAEGWRAYLADPASANATMAKLNTAMPPSTFAAVADAQKPLIETEGTKARGLGTMTEERWATLARQLAELGVIDKAPKATDCFSLAALP
jgi:NitT/TauT family transport system substrate-binding protein